jgi:hypothetical protein
MLEQNRLVISFSRVTSRDATGQPATHVRESISLVHPDDDGRAKNKGGKATDGFREIGAMFRGNPDYFDVEYTKLEASV